MSVTRRKYSSNGKTRRAATYSAAVRVNGKLYRKGGFPDKETATYWENQKRLSLIRGDIGMPDNSRVTAQKLPDLIEAFTEELRRAKRDNMYTYTTEKRLFRLCDECGWYQLRDITLEKFYGWRSNPPTDRGRKMIKSAKTFNQYLESLQQFIEWCLRGTSVNNPFMRATPMREIEQIPYRRAATRDELKALLGSVDENRKLFYLFVIYTPLRRDTLSNLTWGDMHLDTSPAWISIPGLHNKSRRIEKSAIHDDLLAALKERRKAASKPVFESIPSVDEIRADWENAGITFDIKGRQRLDLHSFRKTAIKLLKASGVSLDQASKILHHKHESTTKKYYDEDEVNPPIVEAVKKIESIV